MKIVTLFTYCILSFSLAHAIGFDCNTTITTSDGTIKPIRKLSVGDEVICYNEHLQPQSSTVRGIFEITTDAGIEVITEEDVIIHTSNTEQFFLPQHKLWVCAQNLKDGDYLLNINLEEVRITKVTQQYGERKFFVIAIDTYHNFLASNGQYLVHNGPWAAWQAYWTTKVGLYALCGVTVTGAAAGIGTTSPAISAVICTCLPEMAAGTATICAATAAAIEAAAASAFAAALLCPYTPW
jgi:hypothetical protein